MTRRSRDWDRWMARHERRETTWARRRRKIAALIADVERRMEAARRENPCPEHAPTACRITARRLRELRVEWDGYTRRMLAIDADDPDLID